MKVDYDPNDEGQGNGGFQLPPEGRYLVRVRECEEKMSSNDNPYLNLWLEGIEGEWKGRIVVFDKLMAGKGANITYKKMTMLGLELDPGDDVPAEALVGRTAFVWVVHREWPKDSGKMQSAVDINANKTCGYEQAEDSLPF